MAAPRPLLRLLHVLEIEEEQRRLELEKALEELRSLERALEAAGDRSRDGRRLIAASAGSGELADRVAGLEETLAAARCAKFLGQKIAFSEEEAAGNRREFLAKQIERRQAETVLEGMEARRSADEARRSQQALDEWHLNRQRRSGAKKDLEDSSRSSKAPVARGGASRKT